MQENQDVDRGLDDSPRPPLTIVYAGGHRRSWSPGFIVATALSVLIFLTLAWNVWRRFTE